jgi:hypothetical protein
MDAGPKSGAFLLEKDTAQVPRTSELACETLPSLEFKS